MTVYDAAAIGGGLSGSPLAILELFSDKPRALAVSSDGSTVYAAAYQSGNQTTSVHELAVCDGGVGAAPCDYLDAQFPGGVPAPNVNVEGLPQPETGLIVRYDPALGIWKDGLDRDWSDSVRFDLPDEDVFQIDANANPPVVTDTFNSVGTVLFNMAVNPVSGKVYVSNTEAINEVRFANPNTFDTSPLRGHQHEARITILDGSSILPRHLNKHIDYSAIPVPAGVLPKSLASPLGMVVSSDGLDLYVAAMGSNKIGVFRTSELEGDSFVPDAADHIAVAGGPTGLVLDEGSNRLYVLTRFDNSVVVVDLAGAAEVSRLPLHTPESHFTTEGRPFLYDATLSSSNGEASCASCHVFGDFDGLAWDLGDPLELVVPADPPQLPVDIHPLKGPMVTMSLRGMANQGPLHLRGDRNGLLDTPPTDPMNELSSFRTFNPAFGGLLGRDAGAIDDDDMSKFAIFAERIAYPPNPIRSLNNSLSAPEQRGHDLYRAPIVFVPNPQQRSCQGCHLIDGSAGVYGTDRLIQPGVGDWYKSPHFRNLYQRVGMFGMPTVPFSITPDIPLFEPGDNAHTGDQIRGFGFEHAGAVDTIFRFNRYFLFVYAGSPGSASRDQDRRDLEAYMLAIETNLAPIVGQQVTLDQNNAAVAGSRIDLLTARSQAVYPNADDASATECDLVVKGTIGDSARGWLLRGTTYYSDRIGDSLDDAQLRALATVPGQELTYTCVPPGSGRRVAIDRDGDGVLDGDEIDREMNPAVADRILGGGSKKKDCIATFTVLNPANEPVLDRRGALRNVQVCRDGDALCDSDGQADGECQFELRACFNAVTESCTSAGLGNWQLRRPRFDSSRAVEAANATSLLAAIRGLDFSAEITTDSDRIVFANPVSPSDACTDLVSFTVPLRGSNLDRAGKYRIATRATDAAGTKDTDRLRLVCLPAAP